MSLLNDDLSVWEIGFRWAEYDPLQARFRLPLAVRDNFRILMDAVLNLHLECITLNIEKYQGSDAEEAKFHIRYWLDDVQACIEGKKHSKAILKWARIERWEFKRWCENRNIPLPEFWFPPGWTLDYQWDESVPHISDKADEANDADSRSSEQFRLNQKIVIACKQVAENLWKRHPEMTIAAMVEHDVIQELCGAAPYTPKTVRGWLSPVAPVEVKQRRGRPPKKNTSEDVE